VGRILIVDDEPQILASLAMVLRSSGHDVVTVEDGASAIGRIEADSFDLLITDIRMSPVDGMQVLAAARRSRPGMSTIVISAYGSAGTVQQATDLGCTAYLKKPFGMAQLLQTVDQALAPR
jgi:DNA-binding NtrC family response regulator